MKGPTENHFLRHGLPVKISLLLLMCYQTSICTGTSRWLTEEVKATIEKQVIIDFLREKSDVDRKV